MKAVRAIRPPSLGVGLVWWPQLDALCRDSECIVDFIEIEPEAFWVPASNGRQIHSLVSAAVGHLPHPKLVHGVGAPFGGTCLPPAHHTSTLAQDVADLSPAFVSEHLSFTHFRPRAENSAFFSGFMLPPLQSQAGVELAVNNIRRHRLTLGNIPLAVETPVNYLPPAPGEWTDGEYVAAVVEAADCGILLDLHNVLCNARNNRQSVAEFCEAIPLDRVWEIHLAGGEYEDGFYLDAHAGMAELELLQIAQELVPRLPCLSAITLEIIPERVEGVGLANIRRQLGEMRELWEKRGSRYEKPRAPVLYPASTPPLNPEDWETLLGCAITGLPEPRIGDAAKTWWRSAEPALSLYRKLVGEGRASAVMSAVPNTTRLLLQELGGQGARRILAEFWRQSPPSQMAADEGRAFLNFLSSGDHSLPGLTEAIESDSAQLAFLDF